MGKIIFFSALSLVFVAFAILQFLRARSVRHGNTRSARWFGVLSSIAFLVLVPLGTVNRDVNRAVEVGYIVLFVAFSITTLVWSVMRKR